MSDSTPPIFGTPHSFTNNPFLGASVIGVPDNKTTFAMTQLELMQLAALEAGADAADETLSAMMTCARNMHMKSTMQNTMSRNLTLAALRKRLNIDSPEVMSTGDITEISYNIKTGLVTVHPKNKTKSPEQSLAVALSDIIGKDVDPASINIAKITHDEAAELGIIPGDATTNVPAGDKRILAGVSDALASLNAHGEPTIDTVLSRVKVHAEKFVADTYNKEILETLLYFTCGLIDKAEAKAKLDTLCVGATSYKAMLNLLQPVNASCNTIVEMLPGIDFATTMRGALVGRDRHTVDTLMNSIFVGAVSSAGDDEALKGTMALVRDIVFKMIDKFFS